MIGYEWLLVVGILVVIFLWGPKKLPELAKSLGLAKKEYEKTKQEISSPGSTPAAEASEKPLVTAANNLSITTERKTKEQLAKEIAERTAEKK